MFGLDLKAALNLLRPTMEKNPDIAFFVQYDKELKKVRVYELNTKTKEKKEL